VNAQGEIAPLLAVEGLEVRYGPILALRGVSLQVLPGEVVALLGANGAGKSTLLNAVAGLVPATAGRIEIDGHAANGASPESIVRRGVALSPEGRRVFPRLSVEDNLRLGAATVKDGERRAELRSTVLELFPVLEARLSQHGGTLSGGEQQMLAIGRALMSDPKLLLLDEPSLGLAPIIVGQLFDLIASLRGRGVTVLLVEQNVRRSLEIADRAYVLANGGVRTHGDSADLLSRGGLESAFLGLEAS
jgi:branched-chain amino acid transport system ATP-binding protein